jgi:hypothetical protein
MSLLANFPVHAIERLEVDQSLDICWIKLWTEGDLHVFDLCVPLLESSETLRHRFLSDAPGFKLVCVCLYGMCLFFMISILYFFPSRLACTHLRTISSFQ